MFDKLPSAEKRHGRKLLRALPSRTITVGSLFSGSEVQYLAGSTVVKLFETQKGQAAKYSLRFSCDSDVMRQKWLTTQVSSFMNASGSDDPCCYGDAAGLSARRAACKVHGAMCVILKCMIVLGGFSCKDLSPCKTRSSAAPGMNRKSCLSSTTGTTGPTFLALLAYLAAHRPPIYIGENLDELADGTSDNYMELVEIRRDQLHLHCASHAEQRLRLGEPTCARLHIGLRSRAWNARGPHCCRLARF